MAPEGKDKKRKAPLAAAPLDAPQKTSKKQKTREAATNTKKNGPKNSDAVPEVKVKDMAPAAAAPSTKDANLSVIESKKARKRAADYLSDDEEAAPAIETSTVPKKKSKKNSAEDAILASARPVAEEMPTLPVKKKKKRGKNVVDHHVEKLDQLLGTPVLEWKKDKKTMKEKSAIKPEQNGASLTADGLNGVVEQPDTEDADIIAPTKNISTSMQAEAQRTVDLELEEEAGSDSDEEDEIHDQGAALLAGFDSEGGDTAQDEGLDLEDLGEVKLSKKQSKALKKAHADGNSDRPGAVYVGRIPHGFYEHQMRDFFSQFGTITKLRLSRNKMTGASKHFAFVEFESEVVAKIVEKAMDNYLLFGHILKCKFAPEESLHPDVWKGANKRYRKVPHTKIEGRRLEAPKSKEQWQLKADRAQKRREETAQRLKKVMGYEFELPTMQSPSQAIERKKAAQLEDSKKLAVKSEEPAGLLQPPNGLPKDEVALAKEKLSKKTKKAKVQSATEIPVKVSPLLATVKGEPTDPKTFVQPASGAPDDGTLVKAKKSKKDKKAKASGEALAEIPAQALIAAEVLKPTETKKNKKKTKLNDQAAVQKQLNEELASEAASHVAEEGADESDVEIAATTAILPATPAEGSKHSRRGRKSATKKAGVDPHETPVAADSVSVLTTKAEKSAESKKCKPKEGVETKKLSKKAEKAKKSAVA